jgi:hypothetical protein
MIASEVAADPPPIDRFRSGVSKYPSYKRKDIELPTIAMSGVLSRAYRLSAG